MSRINDAIDIVKTGLDAQIALATAEQKAQLANAKLALADIKLELADLKDENLKLAQLSKIAKEIEFGKSGAAWYKREPYCSGCYGSSEKLIHLVRVNDSISDCPKCKARYRYVNRGDE